MFFNGTKELDENSLRGGGLILARDLKAHSPSWRAGDGSHGGKSIQPGPLTSHVRARREQTRDGTVKPPRPSSREPHLLKDSYFFKTVSLAENQVFKMSPWGKLSTCKWKRLVKPSLVWGFSETACWTQGFQLFPAFPACSCFSLH